MSRLLRIVLMWLLAVAVPAQGFAAVSMLNCGPGHHGTASGQASAEHGHEGHSHHAVAASTVGPGHGAAAHADANADSAKTGASAAPGDTEGSVSTGHGIHKSKTGSCSACASCCTAAALPAASAVVGAVHAADVFILPAPRSVAAFLTDGPDRPPRFLLA